MISEAIVVEIKNIVINFFKNFAETRDDQFGYVTEKVNEINKLTSDNVWIAFSRLHAGVRLQLYPELSTEAAQYLVSKGIFTEDGGLAVWGGI